GRCRRVHPGWRARPRHLPGGHPDGEVRGPGHRVRSPAGRPRSAAAVLVLRQGAARSDRPGARGGGPGQGPFRRVHRLAPLGVRAHLLPDRVPQPGLRSARVGHLVFHLFQRRAAHHLRPARPRAGRCLARHPEAGPGRHGGAGRKRYRAMTASAADVKRWAAELDFADCGITTPAPSDRPEMLDRWLERGYGGTMRYIHRQARRRKDPQLIDERARSVIVVLENYYYPEEADTIEYAGPHAARSVAPPRIARDARGLDYQPVMQARLG